LLCLFIKRGHSEMLRRVSAKVAPRSAAIVASSTQMRLQSEKPIPWYGPWVDPKRRPQLSAEEREKVVINQDEWPEEFKDYDPEDPYKKTPLWIEGMDTWTFAFWGFEAAFILAMIELVFPSYYAL
jgi:hypothetical protein